MGNYFTYALLGLSAVYFGNDDRSDGCQCYYVLHVLRLGTIEEETGSEHYDVGQSGDADDGDAYGDTQHCVGNSRCGSKLAVATYMESAIKSDINFNI